jgi:hypothetical protein
MMKQIINTFFCLVLTLVLTMQSYGDDQFDRLEIHTRLNNLLEKKVEYYRQLYPDLSFLILKGGDELVTDMMTLDKALGVEPKSLDYEHPPALREDLMFVSANRILQMLQYKMPSASLFKVDEAQGLQENICVITMHPQSVAADSIQATQNLLGLPSAFVRKIPKDLRLSEDEYLDYVFDHEVYHCLQSMYVGPQKMSKKEVWGEYCHHHNELGADAYALGMNINKMGKITPFAKNVKRIRGTALSTADPSHMTCKATDQLFTIPAKTISGMNAKDVFKMATDIKKKTTIGYDEYLQFMASAVQAMNDLGVDAQISEEMDAAIKGIKPDPSQVIALIDRTKLCLSELSGK